MILKIGEEDDEWNDEHYEDDLDEAEYNDFNSEGDWEEDAWNEEDLN